MSWLRLSRIATTWRRRALLVALGGALLGGGLFPDVGQAAVPRQGACVATYPVNDGGCSFKEKGAAKLNYRIDNRLNYESFWQVGLCVNGTNKCVIKSGWYSATGSVTFLASKTKACTGFVGVGWVGDVGYAYTT